MREDDEYCPDAQESCNLKVAVTRNKDSVSKIRQRSMHHDPYNERSGGWHVACVHENWMKSGSGSIAAWLRLDILIAVVLTIGVIVAILIPANRQRAEGDENLFTLMESDYSNPLFSSAKAIRILNGAAKQVARFAGYDEFRARVDVQHDTTLAQVTRFSGDLFSMLNVKFESRDSTISSDADVYISESFWERAFARKREIIGTIIRINQAAYRIAGITRNGTGFLRGTEIWMPIKSRSVLGELDSMRIVGWLLEPDRWGAAQREIAAAIKEYLSDQPYFEEAGTRFVPVVNRLQFSDSLPVMAGRLDSQWSGS